MKPLTEMSAGELDEFAAWAHTVEQTEHVMIVEDDWHEPDMDARHGLNTEDETAV